MSWDWHTKPCWYCKREVILRRKVGLHYFCLACYRQTGNYRYGKEKP